MRRDLAKPHPHASERVGFASAGFWQTDDQLLILIREYRAVADTHYLEDGSVGAKVNAAALRDEMQLALDRQHGVFHVHQHVGRGTPRFSAYDVSEQWKFVPAFFQVSESCPHGAILLSEDRVAASVWCNSHSHEVAANEISEVGMRIRKWSSN
jgi:hypothetical protein